MSQDNQLVSSFIALSSALTGIDEVQLQGVGITNVYLETLKKILPCYLLKDLLVQYELCGEDGIDSILNSEQFGPVARNIILMWYRGVWVQLPDDWRSRYGISHEDNSHLVSGTSYQAGLQWAIAGAHPIGARHQGFSAWSSAPSIGDLR